MTVDKWDNELSDDEAIEVLAVLLSLASPNTYDPETSLGVDHYARELIATHNAEIHCLSTGQWVVTPWEQVLP